MKKIYFNSFQDGTQHCPSNVGEERIPGGSKRVLLVDTEEQCGAILKYLLQHDGFVAIDCTSSAKAESLINREKFDLAIIISPPDNGAGLDLLARIKHCDEKLPVFFLSSSASNDSRHDAMMLGAQNYISSPIDYSWLRRTIGLS